jgi:hypothetical protein
MSCKVRYLFNFLYPTMREYDKYPCLKSNSVTDVKFVYHRLVPSVKQRLPKFQVNSLCIFALVAVESEQV